MKKKTLIIGLMCMVFLLAVSYLFFAGVVGLICWMFGWTFSWKITTGLWLIYGLIQGLFPSRRVGK